MRLLARVIGVIGLVPLLVAGLVATSTVASATSPVVGHVYVNDNTAGTNTVGGFDPSTPRATGGSFWRPTQPATRSRCWRSQATAR
jgi:hypothetical protein